MIKDKFEPVKKELKYGDCMEIKPSIGGSRDDLVFLYHTGNGTIDIHFNAKYKDFVLDKFNNYDIEKLGVDDVVSTAFFYSKITKEPSNAQNLIREHQATIKQTIYELYIESTQRKMDNEDLLTVMSAMTAIDIIEVNDDIELPDNVIRTLYHALKLGKRYMKNLSSEYEDFLNTVPEQISNET